MSKRSRRSPTRGSDRRLSPGDSAIRGVRLEPMLRARIGPASSADSRRPVGFEEPRSSPRRGVFLLNLLAAGQTYHCWGISAPSFEQRPVASIFRYARRCFHFQIRLAAAAYLCRACSTIALAARRHGASSEPASFLSRDSNEKNNRCPGLRFHMSCRRDRRRSGQVQALSGLRRRAGHGEDLRMPRFGDASDAGLAPLSLLPRRPKLRHD
jgi:hypothetical protein